MMRTTANDATKRGGGINLRLGATKAQNTCSRQIQMVSPKFVQLDKNKLITGEAKSAPEGKKGNNLIHERK